MEAVGALYQRMSSSVKFAIKCREVVGFFWLLSRQLKNWELPGTTGASNAFEEGRNQYRLLIGEFIWYSGVSAV